MVSGALFHKDRSRVIAARGDRCGPRRLLEREHRRRTGHVVPAPTTTMDNDPVHSKMYSGRERIGSSPFEVYRWSVQFKPGPT